MFGRYSVAAFARTEAESDQDLNLNDYLIYAAICLGLVLMAGAMSGMTVGLLSISELELELRAQNGDEAEQNRALKILPVIRNHHRLLVTLLLANAVCMEALPIFLDRMVPSWLAVVISTTLVLIFGEVVPQAICTGPKQLTIATWMLPLVKLMMLVCYPVAYPIARILDWLLGTHAAKRFTNEDLKTLVKLHTQVEGLEVSDSLAQGLKPGQLKMIHGAIDLKETRVMEHMIPIKNVYSLSTRTTLGRDQLKRIVNSGFSRIPVFENENKSHIVGILPVKRLALIMKDTELELGSCGLKLREPYFVHPNTYVLDLMSEFRKGKSHIAIVSESAADLTLFFKLKQPPPPGMELLGIITLEDIIEELLKTEIYDEDDYDSRLGLDAIRLAGRNLQRFYSHKVNKASEGSGASPIKTIISSRYRDVPRHHYVLMKDD
jgi:metal transporter CNNM